MATNANRLRVGVPMGNSHAEFVNVRFHPGAEPNITGFSIDVLKAIADRLPTCLMSSSPFKAPIIL